MIPIVDASANRVRLTLSLLSVPPAGWDMVVGAAAAIQEIVTSASAQQEFAAAPAAFFASRGLPDGTFTEQSREVAITRLAVDPLAQQAAASGDYVSFMQRVKEFRVGVMPSPNGLIERVTELVKENVKIYQSLKAALDDGAPANRALAGEVAKNATASDTVAVSANVAVFENVAVAVDAVIGAEVAVLSAVVAAVVIVVSGSPGHPDKAAALSGFRPGLARLDPATMEFAANAMMGARLLGNRDFEVSVAKEVIQREVQALITASVTVGLISATPDEVQALIGMAADKACQALSVTA